MIWRISAILLAGGISGTLGFWFADRDYPTEINHAEVLNDKLKSGEELSIRFSVYRRYSCAFSANRILIDQANVRYVLPDLEFKAAPGPLGDDTYISTIKLPDMIAAGIATYRYQPAYYCNPLHKVWPIVPPPLIIRFNVTP